jgi:hypothetical protein
MSAWGTIESLTRKDAKMRGAWSVFLVRSLFSVLAAALLATAAAQPSYAGVPTFTCPRDGTWVEGMWVDSQYKFDTWYDGADPKDPAMCYVRTMPLGPHGERIHMIRLYNVFYRETLYETHKLVYNDDLPRGMNALLTGQTDKANFIFGIAVNGNTPKLYLDQRWQRLPNETLTVGDRVVDAMVFRCRTEREHIPGLRTGIHATTKRWFDPKTSIFVKEVVEEAVGGIGPTSMDYVVLQIHDGKN